MMIQILLLTPYMAIAASLSLAALVLAVCLSQPQPSATGFATQERRGAP